jgi:hypothetical protein
MTENTVTSGKDKRSNAPAMVLGFVALLCLGYWRYSQEADSTGAPLIFFSCVLLAFSKTDLKRFSWKQLLLPSVCLAAGVWVFQQVTMLERTGIRKLPAGVVVSWMTFLISAYAWITLPLSIGTRIKPYLEVFFVILLVFHFGWTLAQFAKVSDLNDSLACRQVMHRSSLILYFYLCLRWLTSGLTTTFNSQFG